MTPVRCHPLYARQLVDDALAAYVGWREECYALRSTSDRWRTRAAHDPGSACVAYCAALDREEAAANAYAELIRRITRVVGPGADFKLLQELA
jgi:hypothetical protein